MRKEFLAALLVASSTVASAATITTTASSGVFWSGGQSDEMTETGTDSSRADSYHSGASGHASASASSVNISASANTRWQSNAASGSAVATLFDTIFAPSNAAYLQVTTHIVGVRPDLGFGEFKWNIGDQQFSWGIPLVINKTFWTTVPIVNSVDIGAIVSVRVGSGTVYGYDDVSAQLSFTDFTFLDSNMHAVQKDVSSVSSNPEPRTTFLVATALVLIIFKRRK